ncbi:hypothetical protein [Microlunatus sp. Gsoil 973]|uniref:hypothetical protein n=1 Tax=Microlunatus sp. Gsoil 973 TaxID=2672569 RepID=UPI0012B5034C|nr:hypothetical protein [Microlunatus sp. Gsoil 973]QGN34012.1 hypothetical protein GJV80_15655 [Microlunatus sp. Gsoil 973]
MPTRVVNFAERAQVAIDFSGLNGPQLRQAMAEAGCELSKNHCYKLIRGEIEDPRFNTVAALIAATGVPANWFFDPDIESATPSSLAGYIARERSSAVVARTHSARSQRETGE